MTFAQRLSIGQDHEARVAAAIRAQGWIAESFGQGVLSPTMRDALRVWDTALRWMPDLLCVRPCDDAAPAGDCVRLVDAKWSDVQDTANYDFECKSVAAHDRWIVGYGHHVWLVFYDLRCCRVADALASPRLHKGTWHGRGSGTPFWLLPKSDPCITDLAVAFGRMS